MVRRPSRTRFNPVLGFLGSATSGPHQGPHRPESVSIPCWVFWVLRPAVGHDSEASIDKFQSRAGFSGFCDEGVACPSCGERVSIPCWVFWVLRPHPLLLVVHSMMVFQSRAGFSGFCDGYDREAFIGTARIVSIPCWVFWVLRRDVASIRSPFTVSIPCWVFWVLRPDVARLDLSRLVVSIPCWVFWVLRLSGAKTSSTDTEKFQSRAGFSGFCDGLKG